jgi:hypothetical protein
LVYRAKNKRFRWVDCQFVAIKKCRTLARLKATLSSLPATLEETYERIVGSIDPEDIEDAERILVWLCYSLRSLTLFEIAEALAIDVVDSNFYDDRRLAEVADVLNICPNFVVQTLLENDDPQDPVLKAGTTIIRLAHASVKDFLLARHPRIGKLQLLDLHPIRAHRVIANSCLTYLLHFERLGLLSAETKGAYPFASYASAYWAYHQNRAGEDETLTNLALEKLSFKCGSSLMGACFFQEEDGGKVQEIYSDLAFDLSNGDTPPAIISACYLGLQFVVQRLLQTSPDLANSSCIAWKESPTSLQAACSQGSSEVIKMLLKAGADVNFCGGTYGTALGLACATRSLSAVHVLLECNANVNIPVPTGRFKDWTPLYWAVLRHDHVILSLLLEHGADPISSEDDSALTPLHLAAGSSNFAAIKSLILAGGNLWRPTPTKSISLWGLFDLESLVERIDDLSPFEILTHQIYLEELEVRTP